MLTWTFIRTQIKNNKVAYFSFFVLTVLVSYILIIALSFSKNMNESVQKSFETSDFGDLVIYYADEDPSHAELKAVEAMPEVGRLRKSPYISPTYIDNVSIKGKVITTCGMYAYDRNLLPLNVFNKDFNGYLPEKELKELKEGEIYLPIAYVKNYDAELGDYYILKTDHVEKHFTIVGFVEDLAEVTFINAGNDAVYIGRDDFAEMNKLAEEFPDDLYQGVNLRLNRSPDYKDLSFAEFAKLIEQTSRLTETATLWLTGDQFTYFAALLPNIILLLILLVAGLIFLACLLVLHFNINHTIEAEYKNIGVLKACGLKNVQINRAYLLSYLFVFSLAFAVATLLALPSYDSINPFMVQMISLLSAPGLSWEVAVLTFIVIAFIIGIVLITQLRRVNKVKPREALNEGKTAVYFASGLNLKLKKPFLMARLSLKQFSASFKQYISSILIIAVLFFLCLYTYSLTNVLTKDRMMKEFSGFDFDIDVNYAEHQELVEGVEEYITEKTEILAKYPYSFTTARLNGETVSLWVMEDPEALTSLLSGRLPKYKNEIIITQYFADLHGLSIGDKVQIDSEENKGEFVVAGFAQSINTGGLLTMMTEEAMDSLNPSYEPERRIFYILADRELDMELADGVNERYPELYVQSASVVVIGMEAVANAFHVMTLSMFLIALIFVIISSTTLAGKIFAREQTDYGIYKATGLSLSALRRIFSTRFLFIALIGVLLGTGLHFILSPRINDTLAPMMYISTFRVEVEWPVVLIITVAFISVIFLIARLVSRKIQKVEVRSLLNAI